jgi:DUF4097 and DUF4098 domain-containing protein YvlB
MVVALAAANCLSARAIRNPRSEFRKTYRLNSNGRVLIHNLYGDVRVTAWDRDEVLVQAIKKSADARQLDDARILVDSSSEEVSIRTHYAGSDVEHPASVEYRITVPRNAHLENVKVVNGVLSITGVAGKVKASSVNGSILVDGLEGHAELSTVNGRVEAEFDRVKRCGSISLNSVNGAIRLSIPGGSRAELIATNLSGGIQSQVGRVRRQSRGHTLRAILNRGGALIRLRNVNGGITIRTGNSRRTDRSVS